jgi:hypothetical protein
MLVRDLANAVRSEWHDPISVTLTQQAHAPVIVSDSAGRERISVPLIGSMKAPRGPQSPPAPRAGLHSWGSSRL